jgi:hypothetical protein
VCSVTCGLVRRHRLHDVVDVHWHAAGMRPQAIVNLVRPDQIASDSRCPLEQLSELPGFGLSEIGDGGHMALRFDDQSAQAQRAYAMFDQPVGSPVDQSAGQRSTAVGKLAGDAWLHEMSGCHIRGSCDV